MIVGLELHLLEYKFSKFLAIEKSLPYLRKFHSSEKIEDNILFGAAP
jgi:hypothetical protein